MLGDRYLWATGSLAASVPVGHVVGERYRVVAPQIWLDTRPEASPEVSSQALEMSLPYLRLYAHRLHLPEVFGSCRWVSESDAPEILLLENVPIDATGALYPALSDAWAAAAPVRQVYWLWQLLQLWMPLAEFGVAASLLKPENIRVQGWRVWLLELLPEGAGEPTLADVAYHWLTWAGQAQPTIAAPLKEICRQMRHTDADMEAIAAQMNRLLLEESGKLPLRWQVMGLTDAGTVRSHNEDACYPTVEDLAERNAHTYPRFAFVCDGVGGHEGGEVASSTAKEALKLQLDTLIEEMTRQPALLPPEQIAAQLQAILRVVNNLIAAQNDAQARAATQRMGTTLVLALQPPQHLKAADGTEVENPRELYIAHVGDSRAYWLTKEYCQCLTVDDDAAAQEVLLGRRSYREAQRDPRSAALTQALGTRDAQFLRPTVQRFLIEEEGILLLCSDGVSDRELVERTWAEQVDAPLTGACSLEQAAQSWIDLANRQNGHDNASVVLALCRVSPEPLVLFEPPQAPSGVTPELSEASRALLYGESLQEKRSRRHRERTSEVILVVSLIAALIVINVVGFWIWSRVRSNRPAPPPDRQETTTPSEGAE